MPSGTTHGRRDGCERLHQPRTSTTIIGSCTTGGTGTIGTCVRGAGTGRADAVEEAS